MLRSAILGSLCFVLGGASVARAELDARLSRRVAEVMQLTDEQVLACVPKLNPLVGCANPETLEYPRNYREWDWSPTDPEHVVDPKTGMKFPNSQYPLDRTMTVVNPRGETITIPYYQGRKPTTLVDYRGPAFRHRIRYADRYFFSYAAANQQYDWMQDAIQLLQLAYEDTGDDTYARRLALILYDFGQKLKHYPIVDGNAAQGGKFPISTGPPFTRDGKRVGQPGIDLPYPGKLPSFLTRKGYWGEAGPAKRFAEAFVAIQDSPALTQLSQQKQVDVAQAIEQSPIRFLADHVISYPWKQAHLRGNLQGYVRHIGDIGRLIGEPEYLHFVYTWASRAPFYYDVTHDGLTGGGTAYGTGASFLEKGLYLSGYSDPPGYVSPHDGLHLQDVQIVRDLPFLALLGRAKERLRMPNGDLAPLHDRNTVEKHPGWRNGADTKLLPTPLPRSQNYIAAGWGHALLGDGHAGAPHWKTQSQAHLHFSLAAEHAHHDCNSILLFAHGEEMISDLGYFHHPLRWWSGGTFSHNLVTIDEQEQNREQSKGTLDLCITHWPGIAVARSEGKNAYRDIATQYRRTLIHNTRHLKLPYVIDIFEVHGGDQHDWLLHGSASPTKKQQGTCSLDLVPMPGKHPLSNGTVATGKWKRDAFGYTKLDPFGMWENVRQGVADRPFHVDFRYRHNRQLGSRSHFPAHPQTQVYLGETISMRLTDHHASYKLNYQQKMPHVILRRAAGGSKSVFVAVHELFNHEPSIVSVRQRSAAADQILLEIEFPEHVDRLLYSLNGPQTMELDDCTTNGELAFVSRRGERIDGYLHGGTTLQCRGRKLLSTATRSWSGTLRDTRRKFAGDSATAFLTDARLPLGRQLHGAWLHLTFTGDWEITDLGQKVEVGLQGNDPITTAYQIDLIERRDDMTWIHLLELDPGLIKNEQGKFQERFLGRRIFDGQGTFQISQSLTTVPDYVNISPDVKSTDDFSEIIYVPFVGSQQVHITSSPGATIYYSTARPASSTQWNVYEGPLTITNDTLIRAKATVPGMAGPARVRSVFYRAARPPVNVPALQPGLVVRSYRPIRYAEDPPRSEYVEHCLKIGRPSDLSAIGEEVVADTTLAKSQYVLNRRLGYYGLLKVPANALYTFHIFANPGLTLAIDGEVIHNKRRIGLQRIWKETVALQVGYHDIQMLFSDNSIKEGDPLLDLKLEYGGADPQPIPPEWLFHR